MAKNFGRVNVSITASTGGLTAGLSRAGKQLRGFQTQAGGLSGTLTRSLAGFVGLGRGATMAAVGVKALGFAIKTLLAPLIIVTSLVALFSRLGSTAADLDNLSKTARRLGMSVGTFQALAQAAEEAGISVEQAGTLMTFMTRNIGNLINGSRGAQTAFGRLGLTLADLQGLQPEKQFELISQRIMALPTAAERTTAAMSIFGRQGALAMGLISDAANGAVSDIKTLQDQLGISMTKEQVKGIEMMNDALARTAMVFQGFLNQLIGELAPYITTIANLFVKFFAENTAGWTLAKSLGYAFGQVLRFLAGSVTFLYGVGQVLFSFYAKGFEIMMYGVSLVMKSYAAFNSMVLQAAESLGMTWLADKLRMAQDRFEKSVEISTAMSEKAGKDAAAAWDNGWANVSDPFGAFDAEFAKVTEEMSKAGEESGEAFAKPVMAAVAAVSRINSSALKAIVVGTSEGEEFRNSILRGADPRLDGDAAEATADNTARTADAVEDLAADLAGVGGLGMATIAV